MLLFLLGVLVLIIVVGVWPSKVTATDNVSPVFYNANPRFFPFSLAAANLSVAGAVVAYLSAVKAAGLLILIVPLTFFLGWLSFIFLFSRQSNSGAQTTGDFCESNGDTAFGALYAYCWTFLLCIILGWELYIGSQLLLPVIFPSSEGLGGDTQAQLILAILIAGAVALYTSRGGIGSVIRTDVAQLVLSLALLGLIIANAWGRWSVSALTDSVYVPTTGPFNAVPFVLALLIVNVAYQTLNPLNWHYAEIARIKNVRPLRIFIWAAVILLLFWGFLVVAAAGFTGDAPFPALVAAPNAAMEVALILMVAGFLCSTADSLVFSAMHRVHIAHRAPAVERHLQHTAPLLMLTIAIGFAFIVMTFKPELLTSLISTTGCIAAFVPALLRQRFGNRGTLPSTPASFRLLLVFVAAVTLSVFIIIAGMAGMSLYPVIGAFALGSAIVWFDKGRPTNVVETSAAK